MKSVHHQRVQNVQRLEPRLLLAYSGPLFRDHTLDFDLIGSVTQASTADLNGDQVLDLIIATTHASSGIHARLGSGNGTFQPSFKLGNVAADVMVAADVNEDGRDDLLAYELGRSVTLLKSKPDGTYDSSVLGIGDQISQLIADDFNSDGNVDLIAVNSPANLPRSINLALGNGDGTFAPAVEILPELQSIGSIETGDLNADGKTDLLIEAGVAPKPAVDRAANVFLGTGDGTFVASGQLFLGTIDQWNVVEATGDGRPDVVVYDYELDQILIYPGLGDGMFSQPVVAASSAIVSQFSFGDINGDALPDLLTSESRMTVRLGLGDGQFTAPRGQVEYDSSRKMFVADLDDDGFSDVLVNDFSAADNEVQAYFGNAWGVLEPDKPVFSGSARSIVSADFNGDGKDDLAGLMNSRFAIEIALQTASGVYAAPITLSYSSGTPTALYPADFNGDELPDLFSLRAFGSAVRLNLGISVFSSEIPFAPSSLPPEVIPGDYDGDGDDDLLFWGPSSGTAFVRLSNGDGTFSSNLPVPSVGSGPLAIGDLDGNGTIDLARYGSGVLSVLAGNGDGTFGSRSTMNLSVSGSDLLIGDFDGDSRLDLVITDRSAFALLRGNGNRTFAAPVVTTFPRSLFGIVVADFDDDSRSEIVGLADHPVTLNLNANGTFTADSPLASNPFPDELIVTDFNDDGKPDVVAENSEFGGSVNHYANVGRPATPSVLQASLDIDTGQVRFRFDGPLLASSVGVEDLEMTLANSSDTPVLPSSATLSPDGRTVVFTLPTSIPDDGEYRIAIKAGAVQSVAGLQNTSEAILPSQQSYILSGDINRDRAVNFDDLLILAQNYGQSNRTFSQGNINYSSDGKVDFDDLLLLAQRYGTSLSAAFAPPIEGAAKKRNRNAMSDF